MLRGALVLGALVLGTVLAVGGQPNPADDLALLQGNWKMLQCEYEGSPQMPAETMKQVTGVFDKSEYFLYFVTKDPQGQPKVLRLALSNVTLNPTKNPKEITFELTEGTLKGVKRHGIYELAGNQLKLCYGPSDKPRPTKFQSIPGNGYFLETWARQMK